MKYRREIDGLRAIALLPVTLFHAGFATFSGGFVGVDVFYVISGYLITTLIVAERRAGTFSLARFYERRARRILPALIVVMLTCLPFAWMWMLPDELENFGESLVATTFFSNNLLLWLTSGYFELAAEFKPLAHTWSLGIEEQYYVGFPLLIAMLWPLGTQRLLAVLVAAGVASLAGAEWLSTREPEANFLLLPTRVWELALGSIVALHLLDRRADRLPTSLSRAIDESASVLGLALIACAVIAFDRSTPFPGLKALVPTLGTAAVIVFATPATLVGRALGSGLLVRIGLISYSGYLWQQPLFAFARIRSLEEPGGPLMAALALGSLILAYVSWRLIECPFRNRAAVGTRTFVPVVLVASALIAGAGMLLYLASGFVHRWPELPTGMDVPGLRLNAIYNEAPLRFRNQPFDESASNKVLVLGNSFARDFINAGVEGGHFGPGSVSYSDATPTCIRDPNEVDPGLRSLIAQSDYTIVAGDIDLACWSSDQAKLKQLGAKRIVVIGPKNFGANMNAVMLLEPGERYLYRAKVLPWALRENARLRERIPPGQFVDLLEMILDGEGRVAVFAENRKLISRDGNHLTREGARYIGARIFQHPLLSSLQ